MITGHPVVFIMALLSRITKINPDAPVMISYWSSRHGHACSSCHKLHQKLPSSALSLSDRNQPCLIWLLYVLYRVVGLRFNRFLIETLSMPKLSLKQQNWTIIFGIQLVNLITVCTDERDIVESADKGKTWHGTIRLFVSVSHSEFVVLLSDCCTLVPKSWA